MYKIRILLINNFFTNYGGAENLAFMEFNLFKSKGHEIFFFSSNKSPYLIDNYEYAHFFPEYKRFSEMPLKDLKKNLSKPFYNFEAENMLSAYLKEIKPDIVHIQNISFILTPSVINICLKNKIPTVMTLHDAGFICPGITFMHKHENLCKCTKINAIYCAINRCFKNSTVQSIMASAEFIFRKIHKLYEKVSIFTCPSKALKDLVLRSGIKEEKFKVVYNFMDDDLFKINPSYTNDGYFLYVGRLAKEKGLHYLIEAMTKLPSDIKLHIVGTGPEEDNLKNMVSSLNLTNIEFLGFKTGSDLNNEYKNCIATIMPSIWFEAFGLTIAESYIFGKPVIGCNVGAVPEVIDDGKTGIIIEPGNIDDMSTAINKLYLNNDIVKKMGEKGRTKTEKLYTSQKHYDDLVEIYESLL